MGARELELITIGSGPAGLMCAITAASGVPIEAPHRRGVMVLDKGEIGQFARYGKLRLTHRWHFMGSQLIASLESEARAAGLELHEQERVVGLELDSELKRVETTQATYRARAVALCTGFFPHGALIKHTEVVRPVFSPAGIEAGAIRAEAGEELVLLGAGPSTVRFARELHALRPELGMTVVVEAAEVDLQAAREAGIDGVHGQLAISATRSTEIELTIEPLGGGARREGRARLLLIDYNSYTTATAVTDFLKGTSLVRRGGYIVVDGSGRTSLPGVFAAGNITTPVSGALTALSSGFVTGLSIYRFLHQERAGREPYFFPWLPREGWEAHPLSEEGRAFNRDREDGSRHGRG